MHANAGASLIIPEQWEIRPHLLHLPRDPTDGAAASSSGAAAPSSGAAASSSGQPESQVAFEEPITDISLEPTTGGASQMVFTAGGDILLPPSVIEDFGYTASDMVKASDVRPPS